MLSGAWALALWWKSIRYTWSECLMLSLGRWRTSRTEGGRRDAQTAERPKARVWVCVSRVCFLSPCCPLPVCPSRWSWEWVWHMASMWTPRVTFTDIFALCFRHIWRPEAYVFFIKQTTCSGTTLYLSSEWIPLFYEWIKRTIASIMSSSFISVFHNVECVGSHS